MIESTFIAAARERRTVELVDWEGNRRIVEPYMVYESRKGKRLLHCFQREGYSRRAQPQGWKNPEIASFRSAQALAQTFVIRPEYNPSNNKMFPVIAFAVSKTAAAGA